VLNNINMIEFRAAWSWLEQYVYMP